MAKKIKAKIKLQIPAGKANPAPPVGSTLGQHGVAIMDFCTKFNNATKSLGDIVVPCVITIYEDKSFDFEIKKPSVYFLIKKALGVEKGSGEPNKKFIGELTKEQLRKIAEEKMPDLNCYDLDAAIRIVAGTARQMGVKVPRL